MCVSPHQSGGNEFSHFGMFTARDMTRGWGDCQGKQVVGHFALVATVQTHTHTHTHTHVHTHVHTHTHTHTSPLPPHTPNILFSQCTRAAPCPPWFSSSAPTREEQLNCARTSRWRERRKRGRGVVSCSVTLQEC